MMHPNMATMLGPVVMTSSRCHCGITQTYSLFSAAILLVVSHVASLLVFVIHLVPPPFSRLKGSILVSLQSSLHTSC